MLEAIPQEFGGYYVYRWRIPGIRRGPSKQASSPKVIG